MAELDPSILPHTVGGVLGWIVSASLAVFTGWTQLRKGHVDETANVLSAWQNMVERHEDELKRLGDDLRKERADNDSLRVRLRAAEDRMTEQDATIRSMGDEIAGLKRQLIQHSRSTGNIMQLGEPADAKIDAALEKLDAVPSAPRPRRRAPKA